MRRPYSLRPAPCPRWWTNACAGPSVTASPHPTLRQRWWRSPPARLYDIPGIAEYEPRLLGRCQGSATAERGARSAALTPTGSRLRCCNPGNVICLFRAMPRSLLPGNGLQTECDFRRSARRLAMTTFVALGFDSRT